MKRLSRYLEDNNLINKNQYGFRNIVIALSAVKEYSYSNINKKIICTIFLDIRNAFNSIRPKYITILFNKYVTRKNR